MSTRRSERPQAERAKAPRWLLWTTLSLVSLALHFAWEMLQAPLYVGMLDLPRARATWLCAQASAADAALTAIAYGTVAARASDRLWLARPRAGWVILYLAVGLVATGALEALSVYVLGRWGYGPWMPRVLGLGLSPLLQWIIVPLLTLWLTRRILGVRMPPGGARAGGAVR